MSEGFPVLVSAISLVEITYLVEKGRLSCVALSRIDEQLDRPDVAMVGGLACAVNTCGRTMMTRGGRTMLYAVKLGPFETGEGRVFAYVGFGKADPLPPVLATGDADGLRRLLAAAGGEEAPQCEPALAAAGRRLGFVPAPMPPAVLMGRALLAVGLTAGPLVSGARDGEAWMAALDSSARFWRAAPWRHWHDGQAMRVELTGAVRWRLEACVMGHGGEEFGVALYPRAGALERIAFLADLGGAAAASLEKGFALTFDEEPAFVARALDEAFDLPRVPVPLKAVRGQAAPVTRREFVALAATLGAVARLTPESREASADLHVGDRVTSAYVAAPPPEGSKGPRTRRRRA